MPPCTHRAPPGAVLAGAASEPVFSTALTRHRRVSSGRCGSVPAWLIDCPGVCPAASGSGVPGHGRSASRRTVPAAADRCHPARSPAQVAQHGARVQPAPARPERLRAAPSARAGACASAGPISGAAEICCHRPGARGRLPEVIASGAATWARPATGGATARGGRPDSADWPACRVRSGHTEATSHGGRGRTTYIICMLIWNGIQK